MPPKGLRRERFHVEREQEEEGKSDGREREEGRIKIEAHCGRQFFALSVSTNLRTLTGKFSYSSIFLRRTNSRSLITFTFTKLRGPRPLPWPTPRTCVHIRVASIRMTIVSLLLN